MKMYRILLLCLVFGVAFGACKKKEDPKAAAKALCACHEPVQELQDEMKAVAGNAGKLKDIATRLGAANKSASDCVQQTVANLAASLKNDGFKNGLLNEMKTQCPAAEKLYSRFVK